MQKTLFSGYFYTAITRTKTIHVLIGLKHAANKAVATNRVRETKIIFKTSYT
ncbi:hypothetical protein [Neobacillus massiliamazoniensis]|uniref:hypothetical protein n=1 Tax=Neobacillus massiliamazoniensis TaxID=1499688 RepID=UPI000A61FEA1|nr:hypothetical protein [Neobacillus massiliamazoniensis]